MQTATLLPGTPAVSRIGIGGHYKAMEEGAYEARFAFIHPAIEDRRPLIESALARGITYFDTTWRNEVVVLAETLRDSGLRDKVWINGMVLGAFSGSKATNLSVEDYFNHWLDDRLKSIPGHRFDSFMINAIEEQFDDALCQRLIPVLEKRRAAGDFRMFGFSCHRPQFAREIADRYPAFRLIMVPYNFRNRAFEEHFGSYTGAANIVAMKPLVWAEYGVPFCTVNRLPNFAEHFGFNPVSDIATRALRFILRNTQPRVLVCSVNSETELDDLLTAGKGAHAAEDALLLEKYDGLQSLDKGIPVFLGALMCDNLRQNFFGLTHLARVLNESLPPIALNAVDALARIRNLAKRLVPLLPERGFPRYKDISLPF